MNQATGGRSRLLGPALAVPLVWATTLYLIPLGVGLAVGAEPLRLVSSGIQFDQMEVTLNGYRLLIWSPVLAGILIATLGFFLRPTPFTSAIAITGATLAGTLLLAGGGFGIGPGSTLLVGTELRWVWRLTIGFVGLAVGIVVPFILKARAEDGQVDFRATRKGMLLGGALAAALFLAFGPGPLLGRAITGGGSWLGSLVWVAGL